MKRKKKEEGLILVILRCATLIQAPFAISSADFRDSSYMYVNSSSIVIVVIIVFFGASNGTKKHFAKITLKSSFT